MPFVKTVVGPADPVREMSPDVVEIDALDSKEIPLLRNPKPVPVNEIVPDVEEIDEDVKQEIP